MEELYASLQALSTPQGFHKLDILAQKPSLYCLTSRVLDTCMLYQLYCTYNYFTVDHITAYSEYRMSGKVYSSYGVNVLLSSSATNHSRTVQSWLF